MPPGARIRWPSGPRPRARSTGSSRRAAFSTPHAGVYGHWFPDATCNTCWNAVDRHVASGRADQAAIIYDSPVTGVKARLTYGELLHEVATLAAVMADLGVGKGDRVVVYMPMVPEAVIGMLACARIGAIHSVVFGGFAAKELATRIDDAKPASGAHRLLRRRARPHRALQAPARRGDRARRGKARRLSRPAARAIAGGPASTGAITTGRASVDAAKAAGRRADCVELAATDPLYILYTSGTTGVPKGVVRDNGGHMVALKWTMANLYGVAPGEVYWAASDVGWVVGHSYIVYAPLLHGATTILYEGKPVGTPDAGAFWRVVEDHKVAALFTAPTAFRAIKKEDPAGALLKKYATGSLRTLFLAGERADPDTVAWAERMLGVPVIDHWWQTETGWGIVGNPVGLGMLPVKRGSPTVPLPGYDVVIVDEAARAGARRHDGLDRHQAAAAAGLPADAVAARRAHA